MRNRWIGLHLRSGYLTVQVATCVHLESRWRFYPLEKGVPVEKIDPAKPNAPLHENDAAGVEQENAPPMR